MNNLTVNLEFEHVLFGCCGCMAAIPKGFLDDKRKTGRKVYCPNGHEQFFGPDVVKVELEKKKVQVTNMEITIQRLRTEVDDLHETIEKLTKKKK